MTGKASKMFPETERDRIVGAVREAESRTSGEIVPFVVDQSDHYEVAEWRAGSLFALVAFVCVCLTGILSGTWVPPDATAQVTATLVAGAIGMLAVRAVPAVKRFFAGKHTLNRRVEQRAAEAFITEEVFNTRERTGILIFLSLLERRVLIIGDAGINAKVTHDDWRDIAARVVKGIAEEKPAEGLVEAILLCGALLEKHGVARRSDDRDELADNLRIGRD